ncbi:MAG: ribosomal RNA small subunit methyltransferase A [Halobacteriovoraceae bacterium]|jgi:16S rRNA (adenine1518-N6/adenine1519-N6)-dimethyltransferase|nr:ribosomal RNA small subunit methyltransferase A [Halobacteriovoraceae bacterium]MBT5095198.1 ribosomal RNA small subunit methyltransferase A [Halobacteriovoraceae bacterium]
MKLPYANKELGQHFLRDPDVIHAICEDHKGNYDCVLEVGPGPGILTELISKYEKPYAVVEKDTRFKDYLTQHLDPKDLHFEDALGFDYLGFINNQWEQSDRVWLVSNLPYNISALLLIKFIQVPRLSCMTLMFQKEVGQKLIFNGKNMNSLLALTQLYYTTEKLCLARPEAFVPPPKVDSIVVSLVVREKPLLPLSEFKKFETFLRQLFQLKRKQVGKVLKTCFEPELVLKALEASQLSPTLRAESFNLEQVLLLYSHLKP